MQIDVERVQNLLIKKNISALELHERAGIALTTAYKFARDGGEVITDTVHRVAAALEVEPRELIRAGAPPAATAKNRQNKKPL